MSYLSTSSATSTIDVKRWYTFPNTTDCTITNNISGSTSSTYLLMADVALALPKPKNKHVNKTLRKMGR